MDELLSAEWLASVGFKWTQIDRQPDKHWLLWLGQGLREPGRSLTCFEDIGIEVSPGLGDYGWFCWLRSDAAGRYHRFIHLRHLETRQDLIEVIVGITGRPWNPENHIYGLLHTPEQAARLRAEHERMDRRLRENNPWSDLERDPTAGGALPEHREAYDKERKL